MNSHTSWGQFPRVEQTCLDQTWRQRALPDNKPLLPYGQGRSYGDVCLNDQGYSLGTSSLKRFIRFDTEQGILTAESGTTLADILKVIVPAGWYLPVTPGTKFVSLGGAIANDVHGKNHHHAGSFGCHVRAFELLRSNGERLLCTPEQNQNLYRATIGGLGLTGLITWVEISLKKIHSPAIDLQTEKFGNLEEFLLLAEKNETSHEYTVAWFDCMAAGKQLGRGIFTSGNHAESAPSNIRAEFPEPGVSIPFNMPVWLLNQYSIKLFNQIYYHLPRKQYSLVHYNPYFYPLDKIGHWNRMYGKRGFYQFQCVIPMEHAESAIIAMLDHIARSGQGSFLAVLKRLGEIRSPGMLSFPRSGITLALDFANRGEKTRHLLNDLDRITVNNNGAVYPAKDACMPGESFKLYYPQWDAFSKFIDPAFSSSFWRRVTGEQE